jgi:hypothetical protein
VRMGGRDKPGHDDQLLNFNALIEASY